MPPVSHGLQLSQRLTQSLVLAPQLQQSLALLQAPMLELKALVEHELQQNPVLEEVPHADGEANQSAGEEADRSSNPVDLAEPPRDVLFDPATEKAAKGPVETLVIEHIERPTEN